ncbi:zinc-finger-containing protein [Agathobaculum desmolans]|uniref:zinc-finger-containing protein n=1 Tax=Agathobaculum desmolans TaxID=39484 RepID=UPI002ADDB75A|nr:zinc-finger-containing protein [Agathobaculum desmolans]
MQNSVIGKRLHTQFLILCGVRDAFVASGRRLEWLAEQMELPVEQTHIGMFDIAQCKRAIKIVQEKGALKNG